MPPKLSLTMTPDEIKKHKNELQRIRNIRWRKNNPEKYKKIQSNNMKNFIKNNPNYMSDYSKLEKEKKRKAIEHWTSRGITFGDMNKSDFFDNDYMNCKFCMSCNVEFDDVICNNKRHLDHLYHDIPLNIRGIICKKCNHLDQWIKYMTKDSIYNNYVEQYYLDKELNKRTD